MSDVSGVTRKAEVASDVSGVAYEGMGLSLMTSSPSCDFDNNIAASASTSLSA